MRFVGVAGVAGAVIAITAHLPWAGAAKAATLADASGTVLVNTGSGFRAAPISSTLPPGTRVMVRQRSEAKVAYPDFCVVVVRPGQIHTVAQNSPCSTGAAAEAGNLLPHDYAMVAGGLAIGAGVLIYQATKSESASP